MCLRVWFLLTAIKVSCVGFCGVSNKINDTAWTVEEQYFNTTLSLADKGKVHKHMVEMCDCAVSCGERGGSGLQHCITKTSASR